MENIERGTLSKKPVLFLCLHKASSFTMICKGTERRYRFLRDNPYLVKYDEDIEFFDNDILFARVKNTDKKVDKVNEKIADAIQDVIEEDNKDDEEDDEIKEVYTKKNLETLRKSEQIQIIRDLGHLGDTPIRKANRVELILKLQGAN